MINQCQAARKSAANMEESLSLLAKYLFEGDLASTFNNRRQISADAKHLQSSIIATLGA